MSGGLRDDFDISSRADGDDRKTASERNGTGGAGLERRADGSIVITDFALASQLLRGARTRQAGFNADLVARFPQKNVSVLFKEGEAHRRQRSAVARFFAPAVVTGRYRALMTALSARLVDKLRFNRGGAIDDLSLELSVAVAAEIVGLTDSQRPGLGKRLNRFFALQCDADASWARKAAFIATAQLNLALVYLLDVRPSIKTREKTRGEDLISHLLAQGWSHFDILTECVTYATAGMSTTREFIVVAAWHLLERPDLRQRFLDGSEATRAVILEEILRLEPAVGTLFRRTTEPTTLDDRGCPETIAAGTLVAVDVRGVNADASVSGRCPHRLDPDRGTRSHSHMSFGDGPHKCPGASVAIQETSIFLDHLLRLPGLRMVSAPSLDFNVTTMGYVLRNAIVAVD